MQLEQPSHECPRVVAGQVAALDQGDSMRKIRERHAAGEPRAMCALGGVGGRHELACSTAPQPPASAELHDAEDLAVGPEQLDSGA